MTVVKICGITNAEDALAAVAAGADWVGFHFCMSQRRITPDLAAAIAEQLPDVTQAVGVFIDASPDEVNSVAEYCGLDVVQLHGSERPGFPSTRPVMKALKVAEGDLPDVRPWPDPVLLDSWTPDQRGGSGRAWDWAVAADLVRQRRVFIAGGLRPDTVGGLVDTYHPYGVDVSSGVESRVRHKDPRKMRTFVQAVREADGSGRR